MGIALIIIFFIVLALYVCFYVFPSIIIGLCQLAVYLFKALVAVIIGTYSFLVNIFGELYCKENTWKNAVSGYYSPSGPTGGGSSGVCAEC